MPRVLNKTKRRYPLKRFPIKDVLFIYDDDKTHRGDWGEFKTGIHHNYHVKYRGKEVGDISIFEVTRGKYKGFVFVNSVYVNPTYRGKGIGRLLYTSILNKYGNICTYYHAASDDAQAVWKYLGKRYRHEVDFFKDMLFVFRY